jgi:hypothetical protein
VLLRLMLHQHTLQLALIPGSHGIEPVRQLSDADLAGLPIPEKFRDREPSAIEPGVGP